MKRIPLNIVVTATGETTPGVLTGVLVADLEELEAKVNRYESTLRGAGWAVGHTFTPNPDHPDDGACVFIYDDFDGTVCDGLEDDHVA